MRNKSIISSIVIIMVTSLLEACMTAPPETCLKEAEVMNGKTYNYSRPLAGPKQLKDARNLCWDMSDLPQNITSDQEIVEKETNLAKQCSSLLKNYKKDYPADMKHVNSMKTICEEMTHQRVEMAK